MIVHLMLQLVQYLAPVVATLLVSVELAQTAHNLLPTVSMIGAMYTHCYITSNFISTMALG